MKHLYEIDEAGAMFAADSHEQARQHFKERVGRDPEYVRALQDGLIVPGAGGKFAGKTFAQVAATHSEPVQVFGQD